MYRHKIAYSLNTQKHDAPLAVLLTYRSNYRKTILSDIIYRCRFQIIITPINTNFIPLLFCSFIINFPKAAATAERTTFYARHTVRDRYACKTAAIIERTFSYTRHTVRDRYAR